MSTTSGGSVITRPPGVTTLDNAVAGDMVTEWDEVAML